MSGDGDSEQTTIPVIVSRQNEHNRKIDELFAKDSVRQQRINELDRDKESQVEADLRYQKLLDKHEDIQKAQNADSKKLSVVADRISWITLLLSALTLIAAAISAYIGRLP